MPDYGHELEFGVFLTPSAANAEEVVALARLADSVGLDLVAFQDHPYQPRFLDTWTLLAFVAARTERIQLATDVLNLPLRPPAMVARAAASLDVLTGGRVELGLGAGASWDAIEAMGGRRLSPGERVDALEEAIDVIRSIWEVERQDRVDYDGSHYGLHGAARGPAPRHRMQIWVGAYRSRMLGLVGRKADGWLPSMPYLAPGDLAAGNAVIDEAAVAAGRRPSEIRRLLNVVPPTVDELTALALEDGIGTFVMIGDDADAIRVFAETVAPAVRERVASERSRRR